MWFTHIAHDCRFAHAGNRDQLSAWLRPHMKVFPKFGDVALSLTRFFRNQQAVDSLSEPAASATTTTTAITSSSFLQSRSVCMRDRWALGLLY